MPPWTMPNSALLVAEAIKCCRASACAQRSDSSIDLRRLFVGGVGRALVEDHHDVRAQRVLDLHRILGTMNSLSPLIGDWKRTPSFADLAQVAQAEHLEAAGVGQDRAVPAHEAVQAAVGAITSSPGRSQRWKVLPSTICAPVAVRPAPCP
jgi:hypothetical protein